MPKNFWCRYYGFMQSDIGTLLILAGLAVMIGLMFLIHEPYKLYVDIASLTVLCVASALYAIAEHKAVNAKPEV